MNVYHEDPLVTLILGDCLTAMAEMPDASVHAIVTDPPYDLTVGKKTGNGAGGFMGQKWDATGIAFRPETWAECLRVLKPGGHLLAAGAPRTYHRLVCAIEDAGFEPRDTIMHIFFAGFPKSMDVAKAIDRGAGVDREDKWEGLDRQIGPTGNRKCETCGKWLMSSNPCQCARPQDAGQTKAARDWDGWGTGVKPSFEPWTLARKPMRSTVATNVLEHGTGALNIDATRIPYGGDEADPSAARKAHGYSEAAKKALGAVAAEASGFSGEVVGSDSSKGRWPANVILTEPLFDGGVPGVVGGGQQVGGGNPQWRSEEAAAGSYGGYGGGWTGKLPVDTAGGYSRFLLIPKAGRSERERGLAGAGATKHAVKFTAKAGAWLCICGRKYMRVLDACPRCGATERTDYSVGVPGRANTHPTTKSLDLMRHLVRLVCPPGGTILDPFLGSGTTALAASEEGFRCIGIEREEPYLEIAKGRLMATPMGMGLEL